MGSKPEPEPEPDPKWYVVHTAGGLYVCATLLGPSEEMGDAAWRIRARLLTGPAVEDASRCTNMIASYGLMIYDSLSLLPYGAPSYSPPYMGDQRSHIGLDPLPSWQRSGQLPSWQAPPIQLNVLLAEVEATIPITHLIQLCRMGPAAIRRTKTLLLFGARRDGDTHRCVVPTEQPQDELSDLERVTY